MDFKPFKIGKFLLLEKLATGGMAEVYRAKASGAGGFEKQLAIKRILPNYASNEEFRKMFEYEARLSSMLTHANIVQIYDFVKTNDTYLLAMEYVDGKNLRQFINKVKKLNFNLPIQYGVFIINEVCKGLEYAHKKKDDVTGRSLNVVHRDMSPQNIMLSYDGAVKIVDFGIAKAKDRVDETRSGVIKGKFGYMSPEQANGEAIDHRTDIFSTVIILFELLTLRRLFAAENDMATLKLIQECVFPAPTRVNPKIPVELERILLKGLTKDPNLRYQSAGDFQRALQEFLSKNFPSFTQKDLSDAMQKIFKEEIAAEKRRFEQIHRQSIPFSQGAPRGASDFDGMEEALEGEVTRSESIANTSETFVGEEDSEESEPVPNEFVLEETSISEGASLLPPKPAVSVSATDRTTIESLAGEPSQSVPTEPQSSTSSSLQALRFGDREASVSKQGVSHTPTEQATSIEEIPGDPTLLPDEASMPRLSSLGMEASVKESMEKEEDESSGKVELLSSSELPRLGTQDPTSSSATLPPLEPTNDPGAARRRERSLSGAVDIHQTLAKDPNPSPLTQSALPHRSSARAKNPKEPELSPDLGLARPTPRRPSREWEEFEKEIPPRLWANAALLLALVGSVFLLYRFYRSGNLPNVVEKVRDVTENKSQEILKGVDGVLNIKPPPKAEPPSSEAQAAKSTAGTALDLADRKVPDGDCTVDFNSDPPGATLLVETQIVGKTPLSVALRCNTSVTYEFRFTGYESFSENIYLKKSKDEVFKPLKKIPVGTLRLVLNQNAEVSVDDGPAQWVRASSPTNIQVRANRRLHLRFVNRVFHINELHEYSVEEDKIRTERVELGDQRLNRKRR